MNFLGFPRRVRVLMETRLICQQPPLAAELDSGLEQPHQHRLKRILPRRAMSKIRGIVPVVLATAIGVGNGMPQHESV